MFSSKQFSTLFGLFSGHFGSSLVLYGFEWFGVVVCCGLDQLLRLFESVVCFGLPYFYMLSLSSVMFGC